MEDEQRLWREYRAEKFEGGRAAPGSQTRLYFDAVIVLGANPEHTAGLIPEFDHFGCHHGCAAERTHVLVMLALVSQARTRSFGYFFSH